MSVELERVGWEDGTLVTPARVNISGVTYDVTDATYSGETPLSAQNLKQMENNAENGINEGVLQSNSYAETERHIGYWVDGKPIYRKVILFGALPNNAYKSVAHNINNLNKVISLTAFANSNASSGGGIPIPHAVDQYPTTLYIDYTNVTVVTTNDRTPYTDTYIIVEYTKTTD